MPSGQEVRYTVVVDGMGRVVSGFNQGEQAANSFERSVSGLNSTFKELALAGGIAFGVGAIVSAGKEWVQTSADLEQSFIRIQNASKDTGEALKNSLFINEEVDKYKIGLQEASDSWGKFIFRIKNANLSGDMQRHIEDEMLAISKVAALPASEMDRLTYNVGTMLAEGVMDARHLRGIANVHPQLLPYLAEALGLKDNEKTQFSKLLKGEEFNLNQQQQLFRLISSGKLTKQGIKSDYLLTALDKYYQDAVTPDKLAKSLTSIQSEINDVDNAWLRMKEDIVVSLKPELIELFGVIKDGATWIRQNKDEIKEWAIIGANIGKAWIEYKAIMTLVNIADAAYLGFMQGYVGESASVVSATQLQATAMTELAASMEAVALAATHMAAGTSASAMGLGMYGIPLANAGAVTGTEAGAAGAVVGGGLSAAILPVAIMFMAGTVLDQFIGLKDNKGNLIPFYDVFSKNDAKKERDAERQAMESAGMVDANRGKGLEGANWLTKEEFAESIKPLASSQGYLNYLLQTNPMPSFYELYNKGKKGNTENKTAAKDVIHGQHVITYNYNIKEIVGQRVDKQTINNGSDINIDTIMTEVARGLESVTYNNQQGGQ